MDSLNLCLYLKVVGMYFKLIFLLYVRIVVRKCVRIRLLNERVFYIVKYFFLILIMFNVVVIS